MGKSGWRHLCMSPKYLLRGSYSRSSCYHGHSSILKCLASHQDKRAKQLVSTHVSHVNNSAEIRDHSRFEIWVVGYVEWIFLRKKQKLSPNFHSKNRKTSTLSVTLTHFSKILFRTTSQCTKRTLIGIESTFNSTTLNGKEHASQGFRIYFVWNPRLKAMESTS